MLCDRVTGPLSQAEQTYVNPTRSTVAALNDTPAPRWDMVKNNQLQLWLTNKEHALNFDPFSKWTFISLMNYNFLIS